jgi:hypothetical protein
MATTIKWTILQLDCKPQEDGETDVVVVAHWQCAGVDGDYSGRVYGTAGFTYTPGDPFTPYADLTQDQVLGWCYANGVDKDATEASVEQQIQNQINPPIVTPPLPWAPAPTEEAA